MVEEKEVLEQLEQILDPELTVNVVELGMVYEVDVNGKEAEVKMTLSQPKSPVASVIVKKAEEKIEELEGIDNAHVEIVSEPAWDPEKMSDKAKRTLGYNS